MEKFTVLVDVIQTSLTENSSVTLRDCMGFWQDDNQLCYFESENARVKVFLTTQHELIKIIRVAQQVTEIRCDLNNETMAKVSTEYGDFDFIVETKELIVNQNLIKVHYHLKNDDTVINDVRFEWIIKEGQS